MGVVITPLKARSGSSLAETTITANSYKQKLPAAKILLSSNELTTDVEGSEYQGFAIPEFNRRRNRGELLPHTPWESFYQDGTSTGRYEFIDYAGYTRWVEPENPAYEEWITTRDEIEEHKPTGLDRYVQEAAAKIYENGFDALTFVAELKDLKKQFVNVGKLLKSLRRPKPGSVNWRKVNSEYLGARYGWRPLVYDLIGLDKAVRNLNEARTRYSERAGNRYSSETTDFATIYWWAFKLRKQLTTKVTVQVRGSVAADIVVPAFQFNPLTTAWELVPFSFVIDWWVSIGKALSALSFAVKQKSYTASTGYHISVQKTLTVETVKFNANYSSGHGFSQTGSSETTLLVRTPTTIQFSPHLAVKLNEFKVLDLVSLVLQRFK